MCNNSLILRFKKKELLNHSVAMHITDASNLCKKPIIVNIGRIWLQNVINVLYSICCNISFLKKQYFGV